MYLEVFLKKNYLKKLKFLDFERANPIIEIIAG
jgi:hypothetical protein